MAREVTAQIREQIAAWEGVVLYAYDDAVYPTRPVLAGEKLLGTLTVGAGHTGPDVYRGQKITRDQADVLLERDLSAAQLAVERLVRQPLTDNRFGALVDFVFNCGEGAFETSTLLKKVNTGDYLAVPAELAKWVHTRIDGKSVISKGLVARRAHEAALWSNAGATAATVVPTIGATAVGTTKPPVTIPDGVAAGAAGVIAGATSAAQGGPWQYTVAAFVVVAALVIGIAWNHK